MSSQTTARPLAQPKWTVHQGDILHLQEGILRPGDVRRVNGGDQVDLARLAGPILIVSPPEAEEVFFLITKPSEMFGNGDSPQDQAKMSRTFNLPLGHTYMNMHINYVRGDPAYHELAWKGGMNPQFEKPRDVNFQEVFAMRRSCAREMKASGALMYNKPNMRLDVPSVFQLQCVLGLYAGYVMHLPRSFNDPAHASFLVRKRFREFRKNTNRRSGGGYNNLGDPRHENLEYKAVDGVVGDGGPQSKETKSDQGTERVPAAPDQATPQVKDQPVIPTGPKALQPRLDKNKHSRQNGQKSNKRKADASQTVSHVNVNKQRKTGREGNGSRKLASRLQKSLSAHYDRKIELSMFTKDQLEKYQASFLPGGESQQAASHDTQPEPQAPEISVQEAHDRAEAQRAEDFDVVGDPEDLITFD